MAMDKWKGMHVTYIAIRFLYFNTGTLTVGMTHYFILQVIELLDKTWHKGRKQLTVSELEKLLGKCARLGE
jgi:hypothetical protein